jgi:hypothetical protein
MNGEQEHHEHPEWPAIRKICDYVKQKTLKLSQEIASSAIERGDIQRSLGKLRTCLVDVNDSLLGDEHLTMVIKKVILGVRFFALIWQNI